MTYGKNAKFLDKIYLIFIILIFYHYLSYTFLRKLFGYLVSRKNIEKC